MYHLTALVTLLAILFFFFTCINVSRSRARTGVKVPAMSGHPDFERAFRIQMLCDSGDRRHCAVGGALGAVVLRLV